LPVGARVAAPWRLPGARGVSIRRAAACHGEVPEWPIGAVSKTVVRVSVPWVRIPPSPPASPAQTAVAVWASESARIFSGLRLSRDHVFVSACYPQPDIKPDLGRSLSTQGFGEVCRRETPSRPSHVSCLFSPVFRQFLMLDRTGQCHRSPGKRLFNNGVLSGGSVVRETGNRRKIAR
jgi:hypothetical protein